MTTLPRPPREPDFRYPQDVARWTRELADYLDRVTVAITSAATDATNSQPLSPRLTALAALSGEGLLEQTGASTYANRSIGVVASTSILSRSDGDGRYTRGPSTATDNAIARFNGANGRTIQNSDVTIDDDGVLAGFRFGTHAAITTETLTGYVTITDAAGNARKLAVVS